MSGLLETALFQHASRQQLLLQMALQNLDQELSQIGALWFRPRHFSEMVDGSAKHLRGQRSGCAGDF